MTKTFEKVMVVCYGITVPKSIQTNTIQKYFWK